MIGKEMIGKEVLAETQGEALEEGQITRQWDKLVDKLYDRLKDDLTTSTGMKVGAVSIDTIRTPVGDEFVLSRKMAPIFQIHGSFEVPEKPTQDWQGKMMKRGWVEQKIKEMPLRQGAIRYFFQMQTPQK